MRDLACQALKALKKNKKVVELVRKLWRDAVADAYLTEGVRRERRLRCARVCGLPLLASRLCSRLPSAGLSPPQARGRCCSTWTTT